MEATVLIVPGLRDEVPSHRQTSGYGPWRAAHEHIARLLRLPAPRKSRGERHAARDPLPSDRQS